MISNFPRNSCWGNPGSKIVREAVDVTFDGLYESPGFDFKKFRQIAVEHDISKFSNQ